MTLKSADGEIQLYSFYQSIVSTRPETFDNLQDGISLRRLDGLQINQQIFLNLLGIICLAIIYHLVMKKTIYFNFKISKGK